MWLISGFLTGFSWGWRRNLSGVLWTLVTSGLAALTVLLFGAFLWQHWLIAHPAWTVLGPWPHPAWLLWMILTPLIQMLIILAGGLNLWRRITWASAPFGGAAIGALWGMMLGTLMHHWIGHM
jgi:hypothetical protein